MNSVKTVFLMTALACILMALGGIFAVAARHDYVYYRYGG